MTSCLEWTTHRYCFYTSSASWRTCIGAVWTGSRPNSERAILVDATKKAILGYDIRWAIIWDGIVRWNLDDNSRDIIGWY